MPTPDPLVQSRAPSAITLRPALASDLPLLSEIEKAAGRADGFSRWSTAEDLAHLLRHPGRIPPERVLSIACSDDEPVGFHRLHHFAQPDGLQVYTHRGHVLPEYRGRGIGTALLRLAEQELAAVATSHPSEPWTYGTWNYDGETATSELLEGTGYSVHQTMVEMARQVVSVPSQTKIQSQYVVRPHRARDGTRLWGLWQQGQVDDVVGVVAPADYFSVWRSELVREHRTCLVAWSEEQLVGLVIFDVIPGGDAYIDSLVVDRLWRRLGIGQTLLTAVFSICHTMGVSGLHLDVFVENTAATRLYRESGFRQKSSILVIRQRPAGSSTH